MAGTGSGLYDGSAFLDELSRTAADALGSPARLRPALREILASGRVPAGSRLPTLESFAEHARISRTSATRLWNELRTERLIETNRRGGSRIADAGGSGTAPDRSPSGDELRWADVDLSLGSPDPRLQPNLHRAFSAALSDPQLNHGGQELLGSRLRAVLDAAPFGQVPRHSQDTRDAHDAALAEEADTAVGVDAARTAREPGNAGTTSARDGAQPIAFTTLSGRSEAVEAVLAVVASPGDRVGIVEPAAPGVIGTARTLGLVTVSIDSDDDGPSLTSLSAAIDAGTRVVVIDPSSAFAARGRLDPERASAIARLLSDRGVRLVEDDVLGRLAQSPSILASRTAPTGLRVENTCRSYGIDLRATIIAGSAPLVDELVRRRGVDAPTSRILQNALAWLMADDETTELLAVARGRYLERRTRLVDALERLGVRAHHGPSSIAVWIEVDDATAAHISLTERGFGVGSASQSFSGEQPALLRLAVTRLPDDDARIETLAHHVAAAAHGRLPDRAY